MEIFIERVNTVAVPQVYESRASLDSEAAAKVAAMLGNVTAQADLKIVCDGVCINGDLGLEKVKPDGPSTSHQNLL